MHQSTALSRLSPRIYPYSHTTMTSIRPVRLTLLVSTLVASGAELTIQDVHVGSDGISLELNVNKDPNKEYEILRSTDLQNYTSEAIFPPSGEPTANHRTTSSTEQKTFFKLVERFQNQNYLTFYGGSEEESHGHFIIECADGGYLQVGETGFLPSRAKILVVKVDSNGAYIWHTEIGNRGHNLGNSAIEVEDGYVIVGALNRNSALIKLDKATGAVLFSPTYDIGGTDAFEHLAITDEGFIVVGYRKAEDPNNTFFTYPRGSLSLISHSGSLQQTIDLNEHISQPYRIQKSGDVYYIAGLSEDANDYVLLQCNSSGTVSWAKQYGGNREDHCFGLAISPDGSLFLTGHTLSGTQNWDTYTIKTDPSGNVLWERTVGNPRNFNPAYIHDEAWGIVATDDGGCIIVAGTGDEYGRYSETNENGVSDQWEVYLLQFSSAGDVEWQQTLQAEDYGYDGDMAGEDIALTRDGHVIIAVDNGSFGFLKINPF